MLSLPGISRLGHSVYRPWLDRRVDRLLGSWYFPLSRAWAAALEADGSVDRFRSLLAFEHRPPFMRESLRRIASAGSRYDEAERAWEGTFFSNDDEGDPAAIQRRRVRAAMGFMAARAHLLPLRAFNHLPAVHWQIASVGEVEAAHGARLAAPMSAFALPDRPPDICQSRPLRSGNRTEFWLRFDSPVQPTGGTAWAHVFEPDGADEPPTLIFMHGIAVEPEFVPDPGDAIVGLVERGIRVIAVEGPWHGRRRPAGYFGGEMVLARAPLGFLEYFHAAALEVAMLIRWARARSGAAVGVGGYSLGSMTAALVASVAAGWPTVSRPDAVLLVAHGADPARVALEGSLMRRIGFDAALSRQGWDLDCFEQWTPLVAPTTEPAVEPGRIVAVLGQADSLTRCDTALEQMRRWRVPESNLFLRARGHYTIAPALAFDTAPLDRFVSLLAQGAAVAAK